MRGEIARIRWTGLMLLLLSMTTGIARAVTVDDPGTFVVDRAGIIDPQTEARMNAMLADLERKTTAQVKVLTVQTTGGEDFFTFAQRHAEKWKLGQQGKDNGALIVLAVQEREVRIQTGYGLEGTLPDVWCAATSQQIARQYFSTGAYGQGLERLAALTVERVAQAAGVTISGATSQGASSHTTPQPVPVPAPGPQYVGTRRHSAGGAACCFWGVFIAMIVLATAGGYGARRGRHYDRWGGGLWPWIFLGRTLTHSRRHQRWMGGMGRGGWSGGIGGGFGRGFGGRIGGGFGGGGSFGGGGRFGGGGGGAKW